MSDDLVPKNNFERKSQPFSLLPPEDRPDPHATKRLDEEFGQLLEYQGLQSVIKPLPEITVPAESLAGDHISLTPHAQKVLNSIVEDILERTGELPDIKELHESIIAAGGIMYAMMRKCGNVIKPEVDPRSETIE